MVTFLLVRPQPFSDVMDFLLVMKSGYYLGETFVCRSFACCRNWGVLSLQQEISYRMTLVGCCKTGFLVMHSWKQYSAFDDYLSVPHFMDNWLEIVKLHFLYGRPPREYFVLWMWKSSVYCHLYWQNGSQYLKLSLQQYLRTLFFRYLPISLFL